MPSITKLTDPLDILVEYGYLDDETPYHKAVSNAVNDFSADQTLGGEHNRDYLSILQNEARKELKLRRKKITGASFKKGSSVGGAQKVAADTTGVSDLAIRKPKASGGIPEAEDVTPQDQAQPSQDLIAPLKSIDNSVNGIIQLLKQSNKADADAQADARKDAEKAKRKKAEGKLEAITGPIGKVAEKVLAPVKSIFGKILGFLTTILLGSAAMKIWDWFANPANTKKIASIFRFLKDWWPVLLAGIMAFFSPLLGSAGMIAGIIALLSWGIPKILDAIKWVKGLFGGGVQKELDGMDKEAKDASKGLEKQIDDDLTKDTEKTLKDQGAPDTENQQVPGSDQIQEKGQEAQQQMQQTSEVQEMNQGGIVPGTGNRDTVPAMLTPGEFVMSKGAVQQYGSTTLAGMNAAAGGTNRPTIGYHGGGTVQNISPQIQYSGGGSVFNFSGGGEVKSGGNRPTLPRIPVQYFKGGGKVGGLPGLGGGGGGTNSLTEQAKTKSIGTWIGDGIQELFGITPRRMIDTNTGMDDPSAKIAKRSPKSASINPPSKPTTVVAYEQASQQNQSLASGQNPSQTMPSINSEAMRSSSKIKTLGIMV